MSLPKGVSRNALGSSRILRCVQSIIQKARSVYDSGNPARPRHRAKTPTDPVLTEGVLAGIIGHYRRTDRAGNSSNVRRLAVSLSFWSCLKSPFLPDRGRFGREYN